MPSTQPQLSVEVFSDVVCPWCYLGKRRLERAIERFGLNVEVRWRAFQLQPDAPRFGEPGAGIPSEEYLRGRGFAPQQIVETQGRLTALAAADGLEYHLDRAHHVNTFDAHRLIKAATREGREEAMVERLFRAQLTEGMRIDDPAVLAALGKELGVHPGGRDLEDAEAVEVDLGEAGGLGVAAVPFFVIDRRFAVSGAQPADVLLQALEQAAQVGAASAA